MWKALLTVMFVFGLLGLSSCGSVLGTAFVEYTDLDKHERRCPYCGTYYSSDGGGCPHHDSPITEGADHTEPW